MSDSSYLIKHFTRTFIGNLINVSGAALLVYDYFLTLPDEIRLIWREDANLATFLFAVIRYGSLVDVAFSQASEAPERVLDTSNLATTRCQALTDTKIVIQLVWVVAISAFVALRIMALWSRNWCLGAFLFVIGLVNSSPVSEAMLLPSTWFQPAIGSWPSPHCMVLANSILLVEVESFYVPVIASAINMAYELLCLILTLIKTSQVHRLRGHLGKRSQARLSDYLAGYGAAYFAVLFLLGILNILSSAVPSSNPFIEFGISLNLALSASLVPILTSRFILDLRRARGSGPASSSGTYETPSLVFGSRTERLLEPLSGPVGLYEGHSDVVGLPQPSPDEGGQSASLRGSSSPDAL